MNDLRAEARRRGAERRAAQGLAPLITDPTVTRLAAAAMTSPSPGPAAVVEGEAIGAAGTPSTGVRRSGGEARSLSPAAPTSRRKPVAATTGSHEQAG